MVLGIYALLDRAAGSYGQPQLAPNDAVICRATLDGLPSGSLPVLHPEDFDVMALGTMDESNGVVRGNADGPRLVKNLAQLLSAKEGSPYAVGTERNG